MLAPIKSMTWSRCFRGRLIFRGGQSVPSGSLPQPPVRLQLGPVARGVILNLNQRALVSLLKIVRDADRHGVQVVTR